MRAEGILLQAWPETSKVFFFFNWIWVWALEIKAKGCNQITTIAKVIHNPGLPLISSYHLTAHNCNCHNQTGHRSHQKFCWDYKAGLAQFPAFPSLMKPTWWGFTACASWGARKISSSFGGWLMLTMTCPKASDWFKASFTWEPLLSSLPSSSPSLPESLLSTIWRASSSPELSSITSVTRKGEKKGQSLTNSRAYCIWKKNCSRKIRLPCFVILPWLMNKQAEYRPTRRPLGQHIKTGVSHCFREH